MTVQQHAPPRAPNRLTSEDRARTARRGAWGGWRATALTAGPTLVVGLLGVEAAVRHAPATPALMALTAVQSVPLLLRHRAPRGVLAVTIAATAVQLSLGYPSTNAVLGQWVAAVAVARRLPRWRSAVPFTICFAVWIVALAARQPLSPPAVLVEVITALTAWGFADAARRRAEAVKALSEDVVRLQREQALVARTAALEERFRIGRELHLVVGKALDAIVLQAGLGRLLLSADPPAAAREIARIERIGRRALTEMDRFLGLLRARSGEPPLVAGADPPDGHEAGDAGPAWRAATLLAPPALLGGLAALEIVGIAAGDPLLRRTLLAVALLQTAPLVLRRRAPIAVLAGVTGVSSVAVAAGLPVGNGIIAVPVAVHAVTAWRRPRTAAVAALAAVGAVAAAAAVTGVELWQLVVVVGSFCGVAWFIGDADRLARDQHTALRSRAGQLDRERRLRVDAAVADERTQLARELHDSVGHTVSLAVLQAGAARVAAATGTPGAREALEAIERAGRDALGAMERSEALLDTTPSGLVPPPRITDLVDLVDGVRAAGTDVELTFTGRSTPLPPSMEAAAFRVAQEALTNVAKHAPGSAARVVVRRLPGVLEIDVSDDGSGPPTATPVHSGGRGLVGIRERVELFGGALSHGATAAGGYRVVARFPLPTAEVE